MIKAFIFIALCYSVTSLTFINSSPQNQPVELSKRGSQVRITSKENDQTPQSESPEDISHSEFDSITNPVKRHYSWNPFEILGAYPDPSEYVRNSTYKRGSPFKMQKDDKYCQKADIQNLNNPDTMYKKGEGIIFTEFAQFSTFAGIAKEYGKMPFHQKVLYSPERKQLLPFDTKIINYHVQREVLYEYYKIGSHFLCATQTFNHIPNHTAIIQKDLLVDNIHKYKQRHLANPSCFNENSTFPSTFRLSNKKECRDFFALINSKEYNEIIRTEPLQYLIKVGVASHQAQGVFLFDQEKRQELSSQFNNGFLCGLKETSLIAQKYIANPLLLDRNNKFDIRVYMLIASTNPLIAFYHDGFIRVSLNTFDKSSKDRATHLTNTALAKMIFEKAEKENKTINGMTASELENYHLWSYEKLEAYLLESGKTTNKEWLNEEFRPAIQKAFIHLVRMTSQYFWKESNVYELFGLDFMLDANMQLWYIECNPNPLFDGNAVPMIRKMLRDMFEIQFAIYRSRMERVIIVIEQMMTAYDADHELDSDFWRKEYRSAARNRIDFPYTISQNNTWVPIIDENLKGTETYFGHLKEECLNF